MMDNDVELEITAIGEILRLLEPLPPEARFRILRYLMARYF